MWDFWVEAASFRPVVLNCCHPGTRIYLLLQSHDQLLAKLRKIKKMFKNTHWKHHFSNLYIYFLFICKKKKKALLSTPRSINMLTADIKMNKVKWNIKISFGAAHFFPGGVTWIIWPLVSATVTVWSVVTIVLNTRLICNCLGSIWQAQKRLFKCRRRLLVSHSFSYMLQWYSQIKSNEFELTSFGVC